MTIWLLLAFVAATLQFASGDARAQADLQVNTPAIAGVKESMRQRYREHMSAYFASGAIGLTRDGLVGLRDANAVPLAQRQQINALIAAENQDRAALYREVARANGHPEWETEIHTTFAQRWIERAPAGWYYQNSAGAWTRK
jgi:hypothetical protein